MSIPINPANLIHHSKIADHFPRDQHDRRVCVRTIFRWMHRGVRVPSGERVLLRHERIGRNTYTTREWIEDFKRAQQGLPGVASSARVAPSPSARPIQKPKSGWGSTSSLAAADAALGFGGVTR